MPKAYYRWPGCETNSVADESNGDYWRGYWQGYVDGDRKGHGDGLCTGAISMLFGCVIALMLYFWVIKPWLA